MPLFFAKILPTQGAVIDGAVFPPGNTPGEPAGTGPCRAVRLLIDTGASHTALRPDVLRNLGLGPSSRGRVLTPTDDASACDVYVVRLQLGPGLAIDNVMAVEAPLAGQDVDGLVGRDVLRHAMLVYQGPQESCAIAF